MKKWTTASICCVAGCGREIPSYKKFCHSHWTMVPWVLRESLVNLYIVGQDGIEEDGRIYTFSKHPGWESMLRECRLAVEEFIRDQRPKLNE